MRRFYLLSFFALSFLIIFFSRYWNIDRSSKYQTLIGSFAGNGTEKLTGPDKANFRDFWMTVDVDLGRVPKERTTDFLKYRLAKKGSRIAENKFNWQQSGSDVAGRSRDFLLQPSGKLLSGSVTGGLWYNLDYRNNSQWDQVSGFDHLSVSCLTYDPQDENILYLGTGESQTAFTNYRESSSVGSGIYKSMDGGVNWTLIESTSGFSYVNDLLVRIENGESVLYAGVASGEYLQEPVLSNPTDGLYRSVDGGESWTQQLPTIDGSQLPYAVSDIELSSDNELYVGTMRNIENEGGGYLLKSSDGEQWTIISSIDDEVNQQSTSGTQWYGGRVIVSSSPTDPNVLYGLHCMRFKNGFNQLRDYYVFLKKSLDGGSTWNTIYNPGFASIPWHALALDVDPNNPHKLLAGGLDIYAVNTEGEVTDLDWVRLSDWSAMYAYNIWASEFDPQVDSLKQFYVHADIHSIEYINDSSDEVIIATDGGLFVSYDVSKSNGITSESIASEFPTFYSINKGLTSTQYYTVALSPEEGELNAIGGTQDNGSILTSNGQSDLSSMISGGDGAFVAWDEDESDISISSAYNNLYYVHTSDQSYFVNYPSGLFINPADYDSKNNRLYANMAQSALGGRLDGLANRYYDTLLMIDVNQLIDDPSNPDFYTNLIPLKAGITQVLSSLTISPHNPATMVIGTDLGQVYRITGLPNNPISTRIDNGQIPVGYISSVDIGEEDDHIVLTISNYGVESVWYTDNGGTNWINLERNLPDVPVRNVLFNPFDDYKLIVATEVGVWGLEDITDPNAEWIHYDGMPSVRVDMLDVRASDSVVVAATHGYGLFFGKLNQGERIERVTLRDSEQVVFIYPNPTTDFVNIGGLEVQAYELFNLGGLVVSSGQVSNGKIDLNSVERGIYVLKLKGTNVISSYKIIKN